jgi:chemotaxis protein MotB
MLAGQLGDLPNRISIEGHTDAAPYASKDGYGNWDLSTDRANAARRVMQASGLRSNQVSQVRGYADQKLRVPEDPLDPSNRRISLIVQYLTADSPPVPANGKAAPGEGGKEPAEPSIAMTAPSSKAEKPAASPESTQGSATQTPPQPGQSGTAPAQPNSNKPAPPAKPSAASPASGNPAMRLWHKVRGK